MESITHAELFQLCTPLFDDIISRFNELNKDYQDNNAPSPGDRTNMRVVIDTLYLAEKLKSDREKRLTTPGYKPNHNLEYRELMINLLLREALLYRKSIATDNVLNPFFTRPPAQDVQDELDQEVNQALIEFEIMEQAERSNRTDPTVN